MKISNVVLSGVVASAVCSLVQSSPAVAIGLVALSSMAMFAQGQTGLARTDSCAIDKKQLKEWQDVDQAHCDLTSAYNDYNTKKKEYQIAFNKYVDQCSQNADGTFVGGSVECAAAKDAVEPAERLALSSYEKATGCTVALDDKGECAKPSATSQQSALAKYKESVRNANAATTAQGAQSHNDRMPKKFPV
ncbi:MAG: hypothetical protein K2X08_02185 [Chlamydiales bacterium]|nr:hypothetical protein [Chlamydiales bacterium]